MKKEKVFCGECKYLHNIESSTYLKIDYERKLINQSAYWCVKEIDTTVGNWLSKPTKEYGKQPIGDKACEINKNNDCNYFEII